MDDYDEKRLTRDEIKAWRCACGAGPEEIVWTEVVSYVRKWDGARFASVREVPNNVEFHCAKCGADVPNPDEDVIDEAINS
jgi:hypothetical protein